MHYDPVTIEADVHFDPFSLEAVRLYIIVSVKVNKIGLA